MEELALQQVAAQLRARITEARQREIHQKLVDNQAALVLHQRACWLTEHGLAVENPRANEAFSEALRLDPNYLDAVFFRGLIDRDAAFIKEPPRKIYPELENRLRSILKIDPTYYPAASHLAGIRWLFRWDWDGAAADYERLPKVYPMDLELAFFYRSRGLTNEARPLMTRWEQQIPTQLVDPFIALPRGLWNAVMKRPSWKRASGSSFFRRATTVGITGLHVAGSRRVISPRHLP
jgi:tetratricopeptide (TPR) repeat protein